MPRNTDTDLPESRKEAARKRRKSFFGLDAADFLYGLNRIDCKERVRQKRAMMMRYKS